MELTALWSTYIACEEVAEKALGMGLLEPGSKGTGMGLLAATNGVGDFVSSALVGTLWSLFPGDWPTASSRPPASSSWAPRPWPSSGRRPRELRPRDDSQQRARTLGALGGLGRVGGARDDVTHASETVLERRHDVADADVEHQSTSPSTARESASPSTDTTVPGSGRT